MLTAGRLDRRPELPEDVWAAVTEPDRLARWIGSWEGDPTSGRVHFRMHFEGDHPGDTMTLRVCEPPHRLHVTSRVGNETWLLELDLEHADGLTTLTFAQLGVTPEQAADVGPGWDYYLDRLVDAETVRIRRGAISSATTTRPRPRTTPRSSSESSRRRLVLRSDGDAVRG